MKTFIYTNSLLVEKNPYASHSEEPSYYKKFLQRGCDRIPIDFYNKCVKHTLFLEYESSKETLPVSGTGWIEGKEYVEGRGFERQWQYLNNSDWKVCRNLVAAIHQSYETRQAAVLIVNNLTEKMEDEGDESSEPIKDISKEKSIMAIVKDRVAQKHGYADYFQIDMIDASLEEKQEIKESMTNEIAYEYAHFNQGEPIKERKQEWDWLGWLQARIPELKKSQNVFWLKQCVNDLLSQSQPYKELSEGEKKEEGWISVKDRLPAISEQALVWQENLTDPDLSRIQKASFIESFFKIYPHSKDGYFKASENFVNYDFEGDKCQITHWMSLPEPPKFINPTQID